MLPGDLVDTVDGFCRLEAPARPMAIAHLLAAIGDVITVARGITRIGVAKVVGD